MCVWYVHMCACKCATVYSCRSQKKHWGALLCYCVLFLWDRVSYWFQSHTGRQSATETPVSASYSLDSQVLGRNTHLLNGSQDLSSSSHLSKSTLTHWATFHPFYTQFLRIVWMDLAYWLSWWFLRSTLPSPQKYSLGIWWD